MSSREGPGAGVELVRELEELCLISSPSGHAEGIARMARTYARKLEALDLAIRLEPTPSGPVLEATTPGAPEPYLLVAGHLDTVLPARPIRQEGTRLYGSGAVDMKGGLVALLGALRELKRENEPLPRNLAVVLVPDEESTGAVSRQAMERWGARAEAVLVVEPGDVVGGRETLVVGRKGLAEFTLEVTGTPAHSGLAFSQGRSALLAACQFALGAERLSRGNVTVNPSRLVAGDRRFVEGLPEEAAVLATSQRINVVPDAAFMEGEFRFATPDEGETAARALQALAENINRERGVAGRFAVRSWVAPVVSEAGLPLARLAQKLARDLGFELGLETCRGGISLPNLLGRPYLPVLDGLGPVGGGMHTEDEYVEVRSLTARALLLARLLAAYASSRLQAQEQSPQEG